MFGLSPSYDQGLAPRPQGGGGGAIRSDVGDMILANASPGADYLLADGAHLNRATHPELAGKFAADPLYYPNASLVTTSTVDWTPSGNPSTRFWFDENAESGVILGFSRGTGPQTLIRSTDGGRTFVTVRTFANYASNPSSAPAWAGGATWYLSLSEDTTVGSLKGGRLYRSDDDGLTFAEVAGMRAAFDSAFGADQGGILSIAPTSKDRLFAYVTHNSGLGNGLVGLSIDGGGTWTFSANLKNTVRLSSKVYVRKGADNVERVYAGSYFYNSGAGNYMTDWHYFTNVYNSIQSTGGGYLMSNSGYSQPPPPNHIVTYDDATATAYVGTHKQTSGGSGTVIGPSPPSGYGVQVATKTPGKEIYHFIVRSTSDNRLRITTSLAFNTQSLPFYVSPAIGSEVLNNASELSVLQLKSRDHVIGGQSGEVYHLEGTRYLPDLRGAALGNYYIRAKS